jgi:hypothetical protein
LQSSNAKQPEQDGEPELGTAEADHAAQQSDARAGAKSGR